MKALLLLSLFLVVSCGKSAGDKKCQTMACEVSLFTLDTSEDGNIPPEVLSFATSIRMISFNASQEQKIEEAADLVRRVIMSQEFKDGIVNHTYNGRKTFVDNNGLTNLQIYNRLIIAAEKLFPERNFTLDVEVELYYANTTTIGYTYPSSTRVWMNRKYFDNYTPYQVAGNLTHEWVHKLGFTHEASSTPSRPYSVPYAVGYLVRELAFELFPSLY